MGKINIWRIQNKVLRIAVAWLLLPFTVLYFSMAFTVALLVGAGRGAWEVVDETREDKDLRRTFRDFLGALQGKSGRPPKESQ